MILQDVFAWPRHRCPIVLLDPHGTLHDAILARLTAENLKRLPVIPIDLRRDDLVISYSMHRRREDTDLAVVCRACADAMLRAWGQSSTDETPRLASWLFALLTFAYERDCTLVEALVLLRDPSIRKELMAEVEHFVARTTFQSARNLQEREFQDRVESTLYRINRFLSTQLLRAMLCQTGESLDFSRVLSKGGVVLACLSTEGTKVAEEDARTLGSVILADVWLAARRRGKREEGNLTPAYVYIDEVQRFLTPTVAEGLAEASGHGLHLSVACQFPSQLSNQGESGQMILDSVLANCRNKVVFQTSHPADVEMLASILYRQDVDPDQIKDETYSTKVLGHSITYLPGFSVGTSRGSEIGWQTSESRGTVHTLGTNWTHTDTVSESATVSKGTVDATTAGESWSEETSHGAGRGRSLSASHSDGESYESSESEGETASSSTGTTTSEGDSWSEGRGHASGGSSGRSDGQSETYGFGRLTEASQEALRRYEFTKLDRAGRKAFLSRWPGTKELTRDEVEAFKRQWPQDYTLSENTSRSDGRNWADTLSSSRGGSRARSLSRSDSHGTSRTRGKSRGQSRSRSLGEARSENLSTARSAGRSGSRGASHAVTYNESDTYGTSSSEAHGGSEALSEQVSRSEGESGSTSQGSNEGLTLSPVLMPVMGTELSSRQFRSVEEQLFIFSKILDGLPDRHCVVRLASMQSPVRLYTRTVRKPLATPRRVAAWTLQCLSRLPFALPMSEALRALAERERSFSAHVQRMPEPTTARRKLPPGINPARATKPGRP
jgi:hypothetical protein